MYFWAIMIIAALIIEAATSQLVSIWFAGGAFAALISAFFTENIWIQCSIFILISALLLSLTKKVVRKLKAKTELKTNFEALLGQVAVVTEDISNNDSKGAVRIRGVEWSARSEDGSEIKQGAHVTVNEINGIKLIVKEI